MALTNLYDIEQCVEKIPESGCWLWTGALDGDGYAALGGKRVSRIVFKLLVGPLVAGDCALHRCDIRSCVSPFHLFKGTQLENIADRGKKGRSSGGSFPGPLNPMAKLRDEDVFGILELLKQGNPQKYVGRQYGVSQGQVSDIWTGKRWGWLTGRGK